MQKYFGFCGCNYIIRFSTFRIFFGKVYFNRLKKISVSLNLVGNI